MHKSASPRLAITRRASLRSAVRQTYNHLHRQGCQRAAGSNPAGSPLFAHRVSVANRHLSCASPDPAQQACPRAPQPRAWPCKESSSTRTGSRSADRSHGGASRGRDGTDSGGPSPETAAASAIRSAPTFPKVWQWWSLILLALCSGGPVVFWLWARAAFDDDFVLRRWHGALWAVLAGIELVVAGLTSDPGTADMLSYCNAEGLKTVDIWVDFLNIKENNNLPYDSHPSAVAHRQYAQKLEHFLRSDVLNNHFSLLK